MAFSSFVKNENIIKELIAPTMIPIIFTCDSYFLLSFLFEFFIFFIFYELILQLLLYLQWLLN